MAASSTQSATSFSVVPEARATAFIAGSGRTVCTMARALRIGSFMAVSGAVNGRISVLENPRRPARLSSNRRSDPQPIDSAVRAAFATSRSRRGSRPPGRGLRRRGKARLDDGTDASVPWRSGQRSMQQRDARLAIHQRVMDLDEDGEPIPLQAVDDVHPPTRTVPLEHRCVQVGDEFVQLCVGARCRQCPVLDMPVHVEPVDYPPLGQADPAKHRECD